MNDLDTVVAEAMAAADETVKADLGHVEQKRKPYETFTNADFAAKEFMETTVQMEMMLHRCGKKELIRLLNSLVSYPINGAPKHKTLLEQNIFQLFLRATEAKYYMIQVSLEQKAKKNTEAEEASEEKTETKEEVLNG